MNKGTTTAQIDEVARRSREHGIIPEFRFVFGDPDEPEAEIENTLRFIRKLKLANPAVELISVLLHPNTPAQRHVRRRRSAVRDARPARRMDRAAMGRVDDP